MDETTSAIHFYLKYISQNFIGVVLLLLVFIIIYTVDYICNYNIILFSLSPTSAIPALSLKKAKKQKG